MKLIYTLLMILLLSFGFCSAAVYNITVVNYDDYTELKSSIANFNWSSMSTTNRNTTATLFLSYTNNNTIVSNVTAICANNTFCNFSKTLKVGTYKWKIQINDSGTVNYSSTTRWLEIRQTNESDWFRWTNDTGFIAMQLNKNGGDLNVSGNLMCKAGLTVTSLFTITSTSLINQTAIVNSPVACSSGYYMTFTNMSSSICTAVSYAPANLSVANMINASKVVVTTSVCSGACISGQIGWNDSLICVCNSTGGWKTAALS